jgi:outer membrane protein assembly factor BamB
MRRLLTAVIFSLTLISLTHAQGGDAGILNPKVKWKFKTQGPIRGSSTSDQENIYFGSADGYLYSVRKNDGELIWKFQTSGSITSTPSIAGSVVFTSNTDFIYAIQRSTGKLLWKFQMQPALPAYWEWDYYTASPVISDGRVFIGSGDGNLYVLSAEQGKLLWKYKTNGRIRAASLVRGNSVYLASNDGVVYVLNAQDGKLQWKFATEGASLDSRKFGWDRNSIYAAPVLQDSLMVIASRDGKTYAVDINSHKEKWRFTYGPTWAMSAVLANNVAYIGWSDNSLLSAIDIVRGKEKWKFQSGSLVYTKPFLTTNEVYIGSADEKIYCLKKTTGEKIWSYKTGGSIYSSPLVESGTVFGGSDDGYFYAIEDGAKPFKAVYHPVPKGARMDAFTIDKAITPYLKDRGFEQLDSARLFHFLEARINDGAPSVIVFSYDHLPSNVVGAQPEKGMIREYLEKGGKIIWLGNVPNLYSFDEKGRPKMDLTVAGRMLDIEVSRPEESGNYYSKATQVGLNWGLPAWLNVTYSTIEPKGVIPLAHDEFNRVSAWLKKFNDRPGSGFISCRSWGWYAPIHEEDLKLIHQLAVHELE